MIREPQDDGDEHFVDVPENGHQLSQVVEKLKVSERKEYDGHKREPRYSNAETSCLWELARILACAQTRLIQRSFRS